jgi:hypothetical protein
VVQIWPGHMRLVYTQISPGHIWTTLYKKRSLESSETPVHGAWRLTRHMHNFIFRTKSIQRKLNNSCKENVCNNGIKHMRLPHLRHPFKGTRSACNRKPTSQRWRNSKPALWEEPSILSFNSREKNKSRSKRRSHSRWRHQKGNYKPSGTATFTSA